MTGVDNLVARLINAQQTGAETVEVSTAELAQLAETASTGLQFIRNIGEGSKRFSVHGDVPRSAMLMNLGRVNTAKQEAKAQLLRALGPNIERLGYLKFDDGAGGDGADLRFEVSGYILHPDIGEAVHARMQAIREQVTARVLKGV